ncbi:MAG: ABC transporter permease [Acidimicrobiia bacterium]|nr:ABC transporter permease [Acidimicrobiia bacterium]
MNAHAQYLLLGLGGGAVVAALALGLLLSYRASGVINFAHAALGTFLALTYYELRERSELILPVLGLPGRVRLLPEDYFFTWGTALAITLVIGALYGLVIWFLVFRPLRRAPALARVVASLGLFLYLFAMADLRVSGTGSAVTRREPILPTNIIEIVGIRIPADRLWLLALVVCATAALALVFRYTRFGLATRAAAESERGAVLLGHSPERLAAVNWMAASVLAGAAMILVAPIAGLNPATSSLLIVPALAAVLLGGLSSFVATTAAGLTIGMVQSELLNLRATTSWMPDLDMGQALPFVAIIAVLALRGRSLPTRGDIVTGHLPRSGSPRHVLPWTVGISAVAIIGLYTLDSGWRQGIIVSATFALLALSIVVVTGYVGQISLMPMALAGVGAFAMIKFHDWGVPFPLAPLLGATVAAAIGVIAGAPAVRVRGMHLAVATLAAAVAIEELVLQWNWFTGGRGGTSVPSPTLGPLDLGIVATGDAFPRPAFGVLCVVVVALCCAGVAQLRRSPTGLRWLAVRGNERAAASAGVPVSATKLRAFALSSFIAGLGGCLFAYGNPSLSVGSFAVFQSLALLALTYLAGIAGVAGALAAGVLADGGLVTVAAGGEASQIRFALNGILLIVVAAVYPEGISGAIGRGIARLRRRTSGASPADPETPAVAEPKGTTV